MSVKIGNKTIGDGHPCFITYEAGPTHDGLESAKRLVKLAAEAGADAVKFQTFNPDRLVADRKMLFSYEVLVDRKTGKTETVEEPLYDILCRRYLTPNEWRELKKYSDSLGLVFFSTVGFEEDIKLLEELECHSIKIASADVNHFPLIRRVARTGMCVQLDTGNATIGEVEEAVDVCRSEGNDNIIIHNCPSGYPARLESINLRIIPSLKQLFGYPVAFSDHSTGWDIDIAALAVGANMLEKTITEDRTTRSVEHIMSLEPKNMHQFVEKIREIEVALGNSRRVLSDEERSKRKAIRRSLHVIQDLPVGHVLTEADIDYRRPGNGITPDRLSEVLSRPLIVKKIAGQRLEWDDFD